MKLNKVEIDYQVNPSSSYIIYICDDEQVYRNVYEMCMSMRAIHTTDNGWYYTISGCDCDCRVPDFFRGKGYKMVAVEHNNGDWDRPVQYDLYIVQK